MEALGELVRQAPQADQVVLGAYRDRYPSEPVADAKHGPNQNLDAEV